MGQLFKKRLFLIALLLSVAAHIFISFGGLLFNRLSQVAKDKVQPPSELNFVDISVLQARKTQHEDSTRRQLVETAVANNTDIPTDGFDGKRNQTVEKQTKTEKIGKLQSATRPQMQANQKSLSQIQNKDKSSPPPSELEKTTAAQKDLATTDHPQLQDIVVARKEKVTSQLNPKDQKTNSSHLAQKKTADKTLPQQPSAEVPGTLPSLQKLMPSMAGQSSTFTEAQRDDTLRDIAVSGDTFLSTRESKFFTYYQRIKDRLREKLNPIMYDKVMDSYRRGRHVASSESHTAQLLFILTDKGILEKVYLMNASGMTELDETAMEALKVAAPFPNPPRGMIDDDGRVRIRWAFTYGDET